MSLKSSPLSWEKIVSSPFWPIIVIIFFLFIMFSLLFCLGITPKDFIPSDSNHSKTIDVAPFYWFMLLFFLLAFIKLLINTNESSYETLTENRKKLLQKYKDLKYIKEKLVDLQNALSEKDFEDMEARYAFIKMVATLIPVIGFLGTVMGIGAGISEFSTVLMQTGSTFDTMKEPLHNASNQLGVAFDTTLMALLLSGSLLFMQFRILSREEKILGRVDKEILENIIPGILELYPQNGKTEQKPNTSQEILNLLGDVPEEGEKTNVLLFLKNINSTLTALPKQFQSSLKSLEKNIQKINDGIGSKFSDLHEDFAETEKKSNVLSSLENINSALITLPGQFQSSLEPLEKNVKKINDGIDSKLSKIESALHFSESNNPSSSQLGEAEIPLSLGMEHNRLLLDKINEQLSLFKLENVTSLREELERISQELGGFKFDQLNCLHTELCNINTSFKTFSEDKTLQTHLESLQGNVANIHESLNFSEDNTLQTHLESLKGNLTNIHESLNNTYTEGITPIKQLMQKSYPESFEKMKTNLDSIKEQFSKINLNSEFFKNITVYLNSINQQSSDIKQAITSEPGDQNNVTLLDLLKTIQNNTEGITPIKQAIAPEPGDQNSVTLLDLLKTIQNNTQTVSAAISPEALSSITETIKPLLTKMQTIFGKKGTFSNLNTLPSILTTLQTTMEDLKPSLDGLSKDIAKQVNQILSVLVLLEYFGSFSSAKGLTPTDALDIMSVPKEQREGDDKTAVLNMIKPFLPGVINEEKTQKS